MGKKTALNRTCSHLIRVNRTILKHFFIAPIKPCLVQLEPNRTSAQAARLYAKIGTGMPYKTTNV
jgi:hypothetical protein